MLKLNLAAGAAAVMLVGCTDDAPLSRTPAPLTITASIDDDGQPDSRTAVDVATYNNPSFVGILWTPGDSIGVFSSATANALFRNTSASSSRKTDFAGELAGEPLFAYYPWTADNNGREATDLVGTIHAVQPFSTASRLLADDYKVGRPEQGSATRFSFSHLFPMLRFDVDASGTTAEGEHLDYVRLDVTDPEGNPRSIAGSFHFDATAATPTASGVTDASGTITMKWTDQPVLAAGATLTGFMTALADIHEGDRLTMTLATSERLLRFHVTCAKTFAPGTVYTFPMELSLYQGKAEYGWTESARASIASLSFTAAANPGKILDKQVVNSGTSYSVNPVTEQRASIEGSEITLMVPYLYDFRLKPTFTVGEGATVTSGGAEVIPGETELDFSRPVTLTVTTAADARDYTVRITNSGLPVVVINQSASGDFSLEDGGNIISHKYRNQFLDFKIRKKDSEWVTDDRIAVYNPDGTLSVAETTGGVRQRGNSTKKYPKKALAIKLNSKTSVLGMPASKRWVLLANWIDHSMIRNTAAFALARLVGDGVRAAELEPGIPWNPSGRNVELVVDGRHVGNYVLAEQIKVEKNRLNIADSFEDRQKDGKTTAFEDCGYLLEFDQSYDELWKFKTAKSSLPVQIKDDVIGGDAAGKELWARVQQKINGVEANLLAGNYATAYEDYDIPSAIDQWLIYELTQNREYTEPRSVYYYINGGGKLSAGPVWDFDRGTFHNPAKAKEMGNETNRVKPYDQWLSEFSTGNSGTTPGVWYRALLKDPAFRAAVKERWAALKPYLAMLPAEIERLGEENRLSWEVNNAMWPTTKAVRKAGNDNNDFKDWAGDEWLATYEEVIANMIECYTARLAGLDALINAL